MTWAKGKTITLAAVPFAALVAGLATVWLGKPDIAEWLWAAGIVPVLAVLLVTIVSSIAKGIVGLDLIAAMAMAGALAGGEALAGVIIAIMFAGGQALEDYAQGRAQAEMTALLGRVARTAQLYRNQSLVPIGIEELVPGNRILVRTGDVIPADGSLATGEALLDTSALTGESMPVPCHASDAISSGVINAGPPFDLIVTAKAAESTYAGIVRLVEAARLSKAPMARLADRYALGFLGATVCLAAAAWLLSGDATRALAVLVIATPCPLILAVPVAIVAGMSRCARHGVMIKTASTIETLPRIRTLLLDKTGTVTEGRPGLLRVEATARIDEDVLVRSAASLAQASHHVISQALVETARQRGLSLIPPTSVEETAGDGVSGMVDGVRVMIGRLHYVCAGSASPLSPGAAAVIPPGSTALYASINGVLAGHMLFADRLRPDAAATLAALRHQGIARIVLLTGDSTEVATRVGGALKVDAVIANATPGDKVATATREKAAAPTMMVGDGINDAPVLASADVGVALGARGAVAASEAADMVVMVDNLDRIAMAMSFAGRARMIAMQSVVAGIGLSGIGMVAAALGYLPPVVGALLQEAIDLAVILNALRALGGGFGTPRNDSGPGKIASRLSTNVVQ